MFASYSLKPKNLPSYMTKRFPKCDLITDSDKGKLSWIA
jgi:hypothetical protein